jgi:uncharacterized protein HemX
MPEGTQQPTTPQAEGTSSTQLLLNLADKAAGKAEDSKGSSVFAFVLFAALAAVCFAMVGWMAVSARRRAAQLEYELRAKAEEQKRLEEQSKLLQNDAARAEAQTKIHNLIESIDGLKKGIADNEAEAVARVKALASASSWNDLVVVDKRSL